jgi:peroxin-6
MPASDSSAVVRRRRPRRRRADKPALSARLVLDDHVKTDVGIVSEDLFAELFPHLQDCWSPAPLPLLSTPLMLIPRATMQPTTMPTKPRAL